jgi:hypothetical protein
VNTPSLKGILPDRAVQVLDQIRRSLGTLTTQFNALNSKPLLTVPQADAAYGPAAQVKALQVSGSNPLNLTGLIGVPAGLQAGFTGTATVRNAAGTGISTFTFVSGVCTKFTP